ncbi:CBS domain-containing protein [Caloramator fervidus]|mgnify:CR=1 FL=1|uniref:CBS domain-containing protein n=1 Tax=Caloramator fervidus TaxID=29344 RepID=A0A1H5SKN7_9CLOT|nr:CBS domain-containing protein [Caloramator fervidus]SEF51010.1 CBS domain-containing protein [Caloramator fervidus]
MKVKDLMTTNVSYVTPNTPVIEIAKIMKEKNIGSVPVVDGDKVVGIVTDRDIVLRDVAMGKDFNNALAKDVMTVGVTTANPNMDVHDAARLMAEKQVRRLPVVENGRLVGMLAIGDLAVESKLVDDAGEALSDISKPTHNMY